MNRATGFSPLAQVIHLPRPVEAGADWWFSMTSAKRDYPTVYELHAALTAYSRESGAPFQYLRKGLREVVRRIYSDAPVLEQELKGIQQRLGTPEERPGDMARVVVIGHQLTNMMCLAALMQGLNKG